MAKKGKPTFMTKEIVGTIRKINARLQAAYANFGINGEYAQVARRLIGKHAPLTKSGLISTGSKGYDPDTINDTVNFIESHIPTVSDLRLDAATRLSGIYAARATRYKQPMEKITEQAIVKQVNAEFFLFDKTQDEFEQYYETWQKLAGSKIYDKALEEKLDEMFRVGSKHIWTDIEYADAYASLQEFAKLI